MNREFVPAPPFAIGLKPLLAENLLLIDDDFLPYRREKQVLYENHFGDVCMAEPGTQDAQNEIEFLLRENLKTHHGNRYLFEKNAARCQQTGESFDHNSDMPIASAGLLIPEDLVLMRRDASGWRLVAASLSFPSSWNLQEKFSKPLEIVHDPVPMSGQMSNRINRIFDGLRPAIPVWRANWSLDSDDNLRHDGLLEERLRDNKRLQREVFLRTEFQTLHKLPKTGDVLFTIRIKTRPVVSVLNDINGRKALATLHQQFINMSAAERDYKGINENAEGFINWMAENGSFENA